jgi:ABC-type dipeptide/oligopeptide/nickel transport system ATPase component
MISSVKENEKNKSLVSLSESVRRKMHQQSQCIFQERTETRDDDQGGQQHELHKKGKKKVSWAKRWMLQSFSREKRLEAMNLKTRRSTRRRI